MRQLPWLIDTPADFQDRCKHLEDNNDAVSEVISLARSELSVNQSHRLHRLIRKSAALEDGLRERLDTFKLGVVSNGTSDLLIPMLAISALRHGIALDIVAADFDQAVSEALNPESGINQAKPDAILIALDFRAFPFGNDAWAKTPVGAGASTGIELLQQIRAGFHRA